MMSSSITIVLAAILPLSASVSSFPGFVPSFCHHGRRRFMATKVGVRDSSHSDFQHWRQRVLFPQIQHAKSRGNHHYQCVLFSSSSPSVKEEGILLPADTSDVLTEAAQMQLPWEAMIDNDYDNDSSSGDEMKGEKEKTLDDGRGRWQKTRQLLGKLKILPKHNAEEDHNKDEDGMTLLSRAPQLLRLPTIKIKATVKTATSVLKLTPTILRSEPMLLTMPPELLVVGYDNLVLDWAKEMECGDLMGENCDIERLECAIENIKGAVRDACEERPGLLLEACTKCCSDDG